MWLWMLTTAWATTCLVLGPTPLPEDGAQGVSPFVRPVVWGGWGDLELRRADDGAVVPSRVEPMGEDEVVVPVRPLRPHHGYELWTAGERLARFTVGAGRAPEPPEAPGLAAIDRSTHHLDPERGPGWLPIGPTFDEVVVQLQPAAGAAYHEVRLTSVVSGWTATRAVRRSEARFGDHLCGPRDEGLDPSHELEVAVRSVSADGAVSPWQRWVSPPPRLADPAPQRGMVELMGLVMVSGCCLRRRRARAGC